MAYEFFALLLGLGWAFIGGALLLYGVSYCKKYQSTRSADYKKYLTNMYVAAKVRALAKKDDLDLKEEEKKFAEFVALSDKERITTLDEKIEAELMERVEKEKKKKGDEK